MQSDRFSELSTGTHVKKKGIFGFTTGLNRLLDFFPTELHNFICMWCRSGNFIYVCGMSVSVESSLFVGGGSISVDFVSRGNVQCTLP